jgi:hypothetical protein
MHDEDIYRYFVDLLKPYAPMINQAQGALLLHNTPLFCFVVVIVIFFLYSLKVVRDSEFPMMLYLLTIYPFINLALKIGGSNALKAMCIDLPELHPTAPDHIRSIEEVVEICGKPMLFAWRIGFFVYRTFCCPNVVDITVFLMAVGILGFVCCVVDVLAVFAVGVVIFLTIPAILTRRIVYNVLVRQLGHPFGDPAAVKTD